MLNKVFKDSGLYIIANFLNKGISLIILSFFTYYFLPSEIGVIETIFIFGSITAVVIPLGISNAIIRFLPDYNTRKEMVIAASTGWWFTVISFVTTFFILFGLSDVITKALFSDHEFAFIFKLGLISQACIGLQYYQQFLLRAVRDVNGFLISNFLSAISLILLTLLFLLETELKLAGVYYAQIIASVLGLAAALFRNKNLLELKFDSEILKSFLIFSLPTVPILICEFLINFIDRIIILDSLGLYQMGIYSFGVRLASIVNILMLGLSQSLTPIIYGNYRNSELPINFSILFNIFLVFAVFIISFLILFSDLLVGIISNSSYKDAAPVISIVGSALVFFGMVNFTPGIGIVKRTVLLLKIYLVIVLINTSLCYLLTPIYGMIGAAISTLISSLFSFSLNYYYSQKFYFIPFKITNVLILILTTGIVLLFKLNMEQLYSFKVVPIILRSLVLLFITLSSALMIIPRYHRSFFITQFKSRVNGFKY